MPDKEGDEGVTQPWLSTRHSQRRRFCHHPSLVGSFTLHDRNRHYVKRNPQTCCAADDTHLSRSPSEFCRKNGFNRPFNMLQILSWIFFTLDIIFGGWLLIPSFSTTLMVVYSVIFGLSGLGTLVAAWVVTASDPADPVIFEPSESEMIANLNPDEVAHCDLCGPAMLSSKHCRACNKCVAQFDHHCKWLNNCVGQGNYRYFFALITLVSILSGTIVIFSLLAIIFEAMHQSVGPRWDDAYGWFNAPFFYTAVSILGVLNIPLLGLDVQLLVLHMYLLWEGLTTFEYITQRVHQPPKEQDSEGQRRTCCVEWIVIDRKRLKRAREKMRQRQPEPEHQPSSLCRPGVDSGSVPINVEVLRHPLKHLDISESQLLSVTSDTSSRPLITAHTTDTHDVSGDVSASIELPIFSSEEPLVRMTSLSAESAFTDSPQQSSVRHFMPTATISPESFDVRVEYLDLRTAAASAEAEEDVRSRWQRPMMSTTVFNDNGSVPVPTMHSPRKRRRRAPPLVEQSASPVYTARTKALPKRALESQVTRALPMVVCGDDMSSSSEEHVPVPVSLQHSDELEFRGCTIDVGACANLLLRPSRDPVIVDMALSDRSTQRSARLLHTSSYVHPIIKIYPRATKHTHI